MSLRSLVLLAALAVGAIHCGGSSAETADPNDGLTGDDQEIRQAPDGSHQLFLGKWESTIRDVPRTGGLPFESNIRSLEFKSERDDSRTYARFRLVMVVRPDCDSCRDETISDGTYRSIGESRQNLKKGKVYLTEGGNTSSREFYEIDGDTLRLKATGLGADSRTVVREFKKVR
jgi:hypothetical protein